jgi:hypothetical protein
MYFYILLKRGKLNLTDVSSGSEKSSKTAVLALKSPTSAHFMSFTMKFTSSFSISKNASIDEYRDQKQAMYK